MTGHYNILSYHIIWWSWFATIWAGKVNGRPKGFTLHRLENGRELFAVFDNMSSWKRIRCSFRQPYPRQCLCTFIFFLFKLFSELSRIALICFHAYRHEHGRHNSVKMRTWAFCGVQMGMWINFLTSLIRSSDVGLLTYCFWRFFSGFWSSDAQFPFTSGGHRNLCFRR